MEISRLWADGDPDWYFEQPPQRQARLQGWYRIYRTGEHRSGGMRPVLRPGGPTATAGPGAMRKLL